MRPLIVLRPEPGATATAAAAAAIGLSVQSLPLFEIVALPWTPLDPQTFDAVMMTSANAARVGGEALALYCDLPLYAVGAATGIAARSAGFQTITIGEKDGAALIERIAGAGHRHVLHIAGEARAPLPAGPFAITTIVVYASTPVARLVPPQSGVAMLHSVRAATRFTEIMSDRSGTAIIAISAAVAAAAGDGWKTIAIAATPTDAAMLALAPGLCKA